MILSDVACVNISEAEKKVRIYFFLLHLEIPFKEIDESKFIRKNCNIIDNSQYLNTFLFRSPRYLRKLNQSRAK